MSVRAARKSTGNGLYSERCKLKVKVRGTLKPHERGRHLRDRGDAALKGLL